jgi:peptidoglycan/LPS O-acetylase OafA/YrhL
MKARAPLPNLTSLRFLAAADVVLFHLGVAPGGYQAVTFFFELSGFILVYVYSGEKLGDHMATSSREFWRARAARILPAYYLALFVAMPWPIYGAVVTGDISFTNLCITAFFMIFLQQAWWPPVVMLWNPAAWSLSVEVVFYALFPWLIGSIRINARQCVALSFLLLVIKDVLRAMLPAPSAPDMTSSLWKFEQFFPLFHLPEFLFGMALGTLFLFDRSFSQRAHLVMLSVGMIALIADFRMGWLNSSAISISFGLIILGATKAPFAVLQSSALIFLGETSYSIYILHQPISLWTDWIERKFGMELDPIFRNLLYLATVSCASAFAFLFIEKPLRRIILGRKEHPDRS